MAIFRNIQMSFWTDSKIADDFTPDDKFFYLYLMTNPHTSLCGCYEISLKQMSDETGYTRDRVDKLISKLEKEHKVIIYSQATKEVLLPKWHKYNWTKSEKFRIPLWKEIQTVKNTDFRDFLTNIYNGIDTVSIPYTYRTDTTVSVSDSNTDTVSDSDKDTKKIYGEYKHVRLTDKEIDRLFNDYGEQETLAAIKYLDEYLQMHKEKKYSDHNLVLRKWVFEAVEKEKAKQNPKQESVFDAWAKA